ncbi:Plasmodium exported protein, unknown function [Plasmodium gallinaceum]|uniref:Uncharacterized protein n=1 Tax=Plasmodium gallinaceum TaxID=5849 RepID=A0A1J1GSN5_PLAGA|nr:Plasmodium exported protein, unknown function [Plasmodium gallinaceum]CRG95452.1 Plasmodium exported protein, unknown function [Plasmodium gallinaceum]
MSYNIASGIYSKISHPWNAVIKSYDFSTVNKDRKFKRINFTHIIFSRPFIQFFAFLFFFLLHNTYEKNYESSFCSSYNVSYIRKLTENNKEGNKGFATGVNLSPWDKFEIEVNTKWGELDKKQKSNNSNIILSSWLTVIIKSKDDEKIKENIDIWFKKSSSIFEKYKPQIDADNEMFNKWKEDLKERKFKNYNPNCTNEAYEEWEKIKYKKVQSMMEYYHNVKADIEGWLENMFSS